MVFWAREAGLGPEGLGWGALGEFFGKTPSLGLRRSLLDLWGQAAWALHSHSPEVQDQLVTSLASRVLSAFWLWYLDKQSLWGLSTSPLSWGTWSRLGSGL